MPIFVVFGHGEFRTGLLECLKSRHHVRLVGVGSGGGDKSEQTGADGGDDETVEDGGSHRIKPKHSFTQKSIESPL